MGHAVSKSINKHYRYDVIIVFTLTSIIIVSYFIINFHSVNSPIKLLVASCLIVIMLVYESISVKEYKKTVYFDTGILNSVLVSITLLILVFYRYYEIWPVLSQPAWNVIFYIGIVLFVVGAVLRILARKILGENFSYALQIHQHHKLITSGIYAYLRHPAYCGTMLLLLSMGMLYGVYWGFIFFLVSLPVTLYRIKREEKILSDYFGKQYIAYQNKVKKIVPFLY